jgi:N-acetylmuramoyl-L-alanine amidase
MATKRFLSAFVFIVFGASQLFAADSKGVSRPARAAKSNMTQRGGTVPVEATGAKDENLSTAEAAGARSDKALVTDIRFLTTGTYTRVMMDLSRAVRYETHRLPADPSRSSPPRIYIDIFDAQLAMNSKEPILVDDSLLRQVRAAQFSQDVVRVVLDLTGLRNQNTFLLTDPDRLVIDIQGQISGETVATVEKNKPVSEVTAKEKTSSRIGIRKIVLDPGHGGKDPGAIGVGGIAEKEIVLSIAKKLAKKLQKEMGIDVVLTRKDDSFIPLEDRTAVANAENADLFVSLHMNASPNADARGIETYYLDKTNDEAAMRLAARENSTSRKNVSDLQFILSDMTQSIKLEDSISLAYRLQSSMVSGMATKMGEVSDLGVKKALFYVLVGARMPSVLVEMFFITNKSEGRAMSRERHQDAMVDALYDGIQRYAQTAVAAKTF